MQKRITIRLSESDAHVELIHSLCNLGVQPVELAPWAITQFTTGGEAILPMGAPFSDAAGLLPNRILTLWPYRNPGCPQMRVGQQLLRFMANLSTGAFKMGCHNPAGWRAYMLTDTLFIKETPYHQEVDYYDRSSSSEFYCNMHFVELESLGPRVTLRPCEYTCHPETWQLLSRISFPEDEGQLSKP